MSASTFTAMLEDELFASSQRAIMNAEPEWRQGLIRKKNGDPKAHHANVLHALRNALEFAGLLAFDEFKLQTISVRKTPWGTGPGPWTERDDILLTEWLQQLEIDVRPDVVGQAVQTVAHEQVRHVVRDYLKSLKWDGVRRIDGWLSLYLGVEQSKISCAFGSRWLISGVARIMEPGCKVDCSLILEGAQGIGKSRALKILAGEWFTDSIPDLHSKDAAVQLAGVWIVELAELDSLGRAESSTIKAFMSRQTDRYRPPYAKRAEDAKRQTVFAGSVNLNEYLKDETGGRRFWPVKCGDRFDLAGLERDRDQLWAEAMARYRAGSPWWIDDAELAAAAAESQAERFDADPWQGSIEYWLQGRQSATTDDILEFCISKPKERWTQSDKNRIARCMAAIGWPKKKVRHGERLKWEFVKQS